MKIYVWYCSKRDELFTNDKKPKKKNIEEQHLIFIEVVPGHRVYLTKTAFYIGEL